MWFGIHKPIPARKFCFYHKIYVLKVLNHALTNQTPHSYQWGVNYIAKEVSITLFIHLLIHSFIYDRSFQWYQVVIFDVKLVIFWIIFRSGPKMRFILSPAFVYRIYFVPQNKSNWCSKNWIYFFTYFYEWTLWIDLTFQKVTNVPVQGLRHSGSFLKMWQLEWTWPKDLNLQKVDRFIVHFFGPCPLLKKVNMSDS